MTKGAHYRRNLEGTIGVHPLEESGGHCRRSTVGGVRMVLWKLGQSVLWKLGQSGEIKKTPRKVGSQKSPERVGLLRTSVGVILYPTG